MKRVFLSLLAALVVVLAVDVTSDLIWDHTTIVYALPADGVGDSPEVP